MSSQKDAMNSVIVNSEACGDQTDLMNDLECEYVVWKFGGMNLQRILLYFLLIVMGLASMVMIWLVVFTWSDMTRQESSQSELLLASTGI